MRRPVTAFVGLSMPQRLVLIVRVETVCGLMMKANISTLTSKFLFRRAF